MIDLTDQASEYMTKISRDAGLAHAGQLPISESELVSADSHALQASYGAKIAVQLDELIRQPVWAVGSAPLGSGWREQRKERKAIKEARRELAAEVTLDRFADAVGYLAQAQIAEMLAMDAALKQQRLIIEQCQGRENELTQSPLKESVQPFRPDQASFLPREVLRVTFLTVTDPSPLFEETAGLYDLIFLTHAEGKEAVKEVPLRYGREDFWWTVTPFSTRLQVPLDDMPIAEQLDTHLFRSLDPFNLQVLEHCYSILLGEFPEPGVITDGPIARHGGLNPIQAHGHVSYMNVKTAASLPVLSKLNSALLS